MSPRSAEYFAQAERFLRAASMLRDGGIPQNAASEAYYAVVWAARAALSERDLCPRTHAGVWTLFGDLFVKTQRFDAELAAAAKGTERLRLDSDYRFGGASAEEADEALDVAERFVRAVREMLDSGAA